MKSDFKPLKNLICLQHQLDAHVNCKIYTMYTLLLKNKNKRRPTIPM